MKKKPLLIFDLDGTLIHSAPDIITAVNLTLGNYGQSPLADEIIISHIGEGLRKLLAGCIKDHSQFSDQEINELEVKFLHNYEAVALDQTTIFPGVMEFLSSYEGPMGIVTNKNYRPAIKVIEHLKLNQFPWIDVYGADTWSEKKPHPMPLEKMMLKAQSAPSQTLMIGDGIPDMKAAKAAGTGAVAIGFGYSTVAELSAFNPHHILHRYEDLSQIVDSWLQRSS